MLSLGWTSVRFQFSQIKRPHKHLYILLHLQLCCGVSLRSPVSQTVFGDTSLLDLSAEEVTFWTAQVSFEHLQLFYVPLETRHISLLFYLSTLVSDDCAHDTIALLWKMSVSDPLCFCGLHMSPRISCFIHSLSSLFLADTYVPWKHFVCKGMYDRAFSEFPSMIAPFLQCNVIVWNIWHVGHVCIWLMYFFHDAWDMLAQSFI